MASLEQIRKNVFSHSIEYITYMPANIIPNMLPNTMLIMPRSIKDRIKNDINNASNTKLERIQELFAMSNAQLLNLHKNLTDGTETPQEKMNLYGLALYLTNFFNNNPFRNLNADMGDELNFV